MRNSKSRPANRWLGAAATLPLLMLPTALHAQSTAAPAADTQPAAADGGVAEIVVTAQKRAENLQKVPIVISVATGAQLTTAGVTSLPTLGALAPGLNTRTTAGAFQPSLRGIGTASNVVENPVALYIDGVYLPQQREGTRELPDVEQVAILKGPQGTLFGRNATGGVIQITTQQPTKDFTLRASAGIDSFLTGRGSVFVSGGLTDNILASFSADYAKQGKGWGDNELNGHDTFQLRHSLSLRGKLLFKPGSRTDITVIGDYMDRKDFTYSFIPYQGTSFVVPLARPITDKQNTVSPIDNFTQFKGGGISLTIDHDLDFAKLVSISAYRQGATGYMFDDAPSGTPTFYVGVSPGDQKNKSFSQEVQLISQGSDTFTYMVGVFYFHNKNENSPILRQFFAPFYGAVVAPPTVNRTTTTFGSEKTESVAPFGQVGIKVFEGTKLTLGARYTYEKRDLNGTVILSRYNGTSTTLLYNPSSLTIKKPTWRISLDHQFSPDVLGYVSYNRGIKSGGFNILNPANPAYLPEKLDAYEAGLKTELFDRHLRLNAGGFYYDYSNLQVTQFVGLAQAIVNGAKARLYGLDADFNARLTPELSLSGGIELLHARFTDYRSAVGSIPKATGGATVIAIDATGKRIPQSQKVAGTLAADYETPVSFGKIHLNATANYNGAFFYEADNFIRQPAYTIVNTSVAWTSTDNHYSVSVWARNLADEKVLTNASSQVIGYPVSYGGPPRTFGITGKINL